MGKGERRAERIFTKWIRLKGITNLFLGVLRRIRFGFQLFLDTVRVNDDRGLSIDRTLVFADAAARTLLFFHDGTFLLVSYNRTIRALFIADEADLLRIPRNASGLVDVGNSHLDEAFLFQRDGPDRFRRADPSAEVAELLTIPDTGNKSRCVKARQSCL